MATIISHRDWMKFTDGGGTSRRSDKLKALDAALLAYDKQENPSNKSAINAALATWTLSKGVGWKTSIRNKNNAVENLQKQLSGQPGHAHNPIALSHVRNESRAIVTDLFLHKKLIFRPGLMTKLAGNGSLARLGGRITVVSTVYNAKALDKSNGALLSAGNRAATPSTTQALLDQVIPKEICIDVMADLVSIMPEFLRELSASCAPFVGVAVSGGTTLLNIGKLARSEYRLTMGTKHADRSLASDDPDVAFQAVIEMLDREAIQNLASFEVGLVEFGSKAASMLVDGGTATNAAIGLASGLVKLLMLARIVVRDVQERNAANKLMLEPVITSELFQVCPVMGAYMICCVPTSVTVNTMLSSERFYEPGMMDTVERAVKRHITPLKFQARRLVKEHRMYIPSLQDSSGVLMKNKNALEAMKQPSTAEWADKITGFGSEGV
jgi:hypothetical protein